MPGTNTLAYFDDFFRDEENYVMLTQGLNVTKGSSSFTKVPIKLEHLSTANLISE
jgi:hypothetical protein